MIIIKNDYKTIELAIYFFEEDDLANRAKRFLLSKLLTATTKNYPTKKEMATHLESLYGAYFRTRVQIIGSFHVLSITLTIPNPKIVDDPLLLDQAIELLKDVLSSRESLDQAIFQQEKRLLLEQWETLKDRKRTYAQTQFLYHLFDGTSAGISISGAEDNIRKLTFKKLNAYLPHLLANEKTMIINGHFDQLEEAKLEQAFSDLSNSKIQTTIVPKLPKEEVMKLEEETNMQQAILKLGYYLPVYRNEDQRYAAYLVDLILGGYSESRLFTIIREQLGLCYDISSGYDQFKGVLAISSGVALSQKDYALEQIQQVVNDLVIHGVNQDELDSAKAYLIFQLQSQVDQQSYWTNQVLIKQLLGSNDSLDKRLEKISQVSIEDVNQVFKLLTLDTIYILRGGLDDA